MLGGLEASDNWSLGEWMSLPKISFVTNEFLKWVFNPWTMIHYQAATCLKLGHGRDGQVLHSREQRTFVLMHEALFAQAQEPSTQVPSTHTSGACVEHKHSLLVHKGQFEQGEDTCLLLAQMELCTYV